MTIVQGLVPYAGTTAELTKLSNYGPRYDSHLLRSVVPPFSSFPISCQVEHSNGKGYSIFVIDQPSKFENYVNRKELTREHCTPNGLHQDDCFVRWWPNIYLKWVQINYSRDYRKTGKVQDAWLTAKSVSTWRPVSGRSSIKFEC